MDPYNLLKHMRTSVVNREKEEFKKGNYFEKVDTIKSMQKSFEYPPNPAYVNANLSRNKGYRLKYLSDFCRENKIPMSNNE